MSVGRQARIAGGQVRRGQRRSAGELMQGGIIQQRRELGSVDYGKWLKVKPLSRPAPVKVDHPSTIAAGQLSA